VPDTSATADFVRPAAVKIAIAIGVVFDLDTDIDPDPDKNAPGYIAAVCLRTASVPARLIPHDFARLASGHAFARKRL